MIHGGPQSKKTSFGVVVGEIQKEGKKKSRDRGIRASIATRRAKDRRRSRSRRAAGKDRAHKLTVPRGDRTHAVIEPFLTDQWYVKVGPLAAEAIRAVEDGRIRFVPENWTKTYYEWMRNIQDWCISRQIWGVTVFRRGTTKTARRMSGAAKPKYARNTNSGLAFR